MKNTGREILKGILHYTIGAAIILVLLFVPYPARFGVTFRSNFSTLVVVIFLGYLLISLLPEYLKTVAIAAFTAAVFTLPVVGLWGSGQSEQYIIGGIIPFSDARFYFMDARRLLEGSLFTTGAARRPLFAALFSTLQWMTGQNLFVSLGLLVGLISLTVYFCIREIHSSRSAVGAGLFLLLIFFYIRFLLGKPMTEMVGLPLGLLAFFFLYRSAREKRLSFFLYGLFLLTLALNARAGAFFILPALIIWAGFSLSTARKFNWKTGLLSILVVAAGFGVNLIVFNVLSNPDTTPFGNFGSTLYGLSRGGQSWTLIYEEHPEVTSMPARESTEFVYGLALDNIRQHPGDLFKGFLNSYAMFFSLDDYYGSLCWFGGSNIVGMAARGFLYLLIALGVVLSIRKIKDPTQSMLLAAFAGILLSVTFLPPRDSNHMRVYAATFPFFAAMPVIGLSGIFDFIPLKKKLFPPLSFINWQFPVYFSGLILVLMVIVPIGLRITSQPIELPKSDCSSGLTPISFRLLPGNHIIIREQGSIPQDWVPDLQRKNFERLAHDLPNWELFPMLTGIRENQMLISDLNLVDGQEMLLIADENKIKKTSEIQSVCGIHMPDEDFKMYNVYMAD